jgi:hypothetical protein
LDENEPTPHELTERAKLITRCRGILLDNGIYNFADVERIGAPGLLELRGLGPKAVNLIVNAVAGYGNAGDAAELFPYPNGLDQTRITLTGSQEDIDAFAAQGESTTTVIDGPDDLDEWPDESTPEPAVTTTFLLHLLDGITTKGAAWAQGYLTGLIEAAEDVPGLADHYLDNAVDCRNRQRLDQITRLVDDLTDQRYARETGGHPDDCPTVPNNLGVSSSTNDTVDLERC